MSKSKFICLFLAAFAAFFCSAQQQIDKISFESWLKIYKIKGRVKHLIRETTDCIDIPKSYKDTSTGCPYVKQILFFDEQGNCISFIRYGKDGIMLDSVIYQYNEKHQRIEESI